MRLIFTIVVAVLGLAIPAFSYTQYHASHNSFFDDPDLSLNDVVCSTGEYGLITKGYQVVSDLPTWPFIGGAPQITGYNSPYCGSCWELTFSTIENGVKSVNITAIDTGSPYAENYPIAKDAWIRLTDYQDDDGFVDIEAKRLPDSACGL